MTPVAIRSDPASPGAPDRASDDGRGANKGGTRVRKQTKLVICAGIAAIAGALLELEAAAAAETTTATGTAEPTTGDAGAPLFEVTVVGFRSSLEKALEAKRNENAAVDSILAEDIGKFPDLNLAESLQRIPGVAISREGGEGRQLTVRGLSPVYTRVRINGMEALSTTGGPDNEGGVNRTRAFDFNVFDSELFNALSIRKTSEADVDEGALGATVDMRTARAFDFQHATFIAQAKGDYNDLSGSVGPRASLLAADRWFDGKFGALASIAYSQHDLIDSGASTVRWDEGSQLTTGTNLFGASPYGFASVLGTHCTGTAATLPAPCVAADSALHPRFPRYDLYQDTEQRIGASVGLQWQPTDANLFSLDVLHSYFSGTRQEQYLEAPGLSGQGKCTPATAGSSTSIGCISVLAQNISSLGVLTSGTFSGVDTRVEDRFDYLRTDFTQGTLSGEHHLSSRLQIDELIGMSRSAFKNPIQTTLGWDQYNQTVSYDFSSRIPSLNFGNENVGSTGPWVLTEVRERPQTATSTYKTAQLNLHFRWTPDIETQGGINYKEYEFDTTSLRLINGETVTATNAYAPLRIWPPSRYASTPNYANLAGVNVPPGSTTTWATPDINLADQLFGLYSNPLFAVSPQGDLGNNVTDRERDLGAYLQLNFRFDVLGRSLRGNIGARAVRTEQHSTGYSPTLLPIVADHDYGNVLPSLNLVYELTDTVLLRAAAGRDMARPNFGDVVGSTSVSVSGTQFNVKTGNPDLDPTLANAYDLALEWYPRHGTIVSVALFYKDVLTLVSTGTVSMVFHDNPFGIPDSVAVAACGASPGCSPSAVWAFTRPVNSPGGRVDGVELNYQQPFSFLPGLLTHTGVLLNYTGVDSSVQYSTGAGTFVTNQLLGLSRNSASATLYYEDDRWSTRVSGNYRSRYLTRIPGQEVGTDADGTDATFNLDASVQYTLTQHLKLTLEGVNLTDQYESQFNDTARDLVSYYHHTGREVLFGIRFQN